MFTGGGGAWAEAQMKAGLYRVPRAAQGTTPDLTGLSCRWSPIQARHGAVVSIIAVPVAGVDPQAFQALIGDIIALAAQEDRGGHPIPVDGPPMTLSVKGLNIEGRIAPQGKRIRQRRAPICRRGSPSFSPPRRRRLAASIRAATGRISPTIPISANSTTG